MKDIIKIKNLNYKNFDNKLFNNFELNIEESDFMSIIGPNNAGKTTLIKILSGLKKYEGTILIDNKELKENKKEIRKIISIVFDNPETQFIMDTVYNDIYLTAKNKKIDNIDEEINKISKILKIENILDKSPQHLSGGEKQKVVIASALLGNPKILILDEALSMIDPISKKEIYKYLVKLNNEGTTIINISSDIEDTLYSKNILILNNGTIESLDTKENTYNKENIFKKLQMELPFIIELSKKLSYYNLVNKDYYNEEELINKLW